jgi:hypothetical protein
MVQSVLLVFLKEFKSSNDVAQSTGARLLKQTSQAEFCIWLVDFLCFPYPKKGAEQKEKPRCYAGKILNKTYESIISRDIIRYHIRVFSNAHSCFNLYQ